MNTRCEGECEKGHGGHKGEVKRVHVIAKDGHDWGCYYYCETAVIIDQSREFSVEEEPIL